MERLSIDRFLIIALDKLLMDHLIKQGIPAALCDFQGGVNTFWLQRLQIWDFLVQREVDFIQSDVDAIWLKNPIPHYFSDGDFDLLISQGTFHPVDIYEHWRFVLCTGLFRARPGPGTKAFFAAWTRRSRDILLSDDQVVMNRLLHEDDMKWQPDGLETYKLEWNGYSFTCFHRILPGVCSLGCRIGMLPHRLFQRLTNPEPEALVKHVRRPKDPKDRISVLQTAGCWLLPIDGDPL